MQEHHGDRMSAKRERERDSTAKHRRFRFRVAREIDGEPLRSHTFTGRDGRQIELVPGETYVARDELELAELAGLLARGIVEVVVRVERRNLGRLARPSARSSLMAHILGPP